MANWSEIPAIQKLGIVFVLTGMTTAGAWNFEYKPMKEKNLQTADHVRAVRADNDSLRPFIGKLADMDRQIESLKQQLEIGKRIVPDEKYADQFIHMVQATASNAGVEVRRYTARAQQPKEFFTEAPFEVDIDGPYYSVLNFYDRLAKLERIINVSGLQMASVGKPGNAHVKRGYAYAPTETVLASFVATTYFSHDIDVPPPAPVTAGAAVGK